MLMIGTTLKTDNIIFWLASDSTPFQYVRSLLALVILILIFTNPPRRAWLRASTGLVAVVVGVWAVESALAYTMYISDAVCFLAASLAIMVAVVERETAPHPAARKNVLLHRNSFPAFAAFALELSAHRTPRRSPR